MRLAMSELCGKDSETGSSMNGAKDASIRNVANDEEEGILMGTVNKNGRDKDRKDEDVRDNENDQEDDEELRDVPIDKGWAWVIVAACFGMHVIVVGGVKSFGVLFVEIKDKYHVTARELGMIQGITMTVMLGLGLVANLLAVKFTCQKVVFIGGILSGVGFILSSFVPSFDLLYLTYGVITGLGFALSYGPCVVMVGIHFQKRRSLANGISISGSGVGSFVLPIIIRLMLNEYNLSGCLLLLGGLMLNVCVCALLFRPLTSYRRIKPRQESYKKNIQEDNTVLQHLIDDDKSNNILTTYDVKESNQHTQEDILESQHHWDRKLSEISSMEYMPMASLQSIQKEIHERTSHLCARLKCSKNSNASSKKRQRKGQKLFDWSLLSNPLFLIYACSCGLGNFAYPNVFLMLPAHAENHGQDRDSAALLISVIGIADLIGRLFFGWFSDLKLIPKRFGFAGCMAISGILNLVAPVMTSFVTLVIYAALYGLFAGSYMALISVMLADALGVEKLSSAYGLVMLVMSFGLLPGPLICGGIRDATLKWDYSFILCGILSLAGSIPPLFEPCAKRLADAMEAKKTRDVRVNKNIA